jgi:hypothetical protein
MIGPNGRKLLSATLPIALAAMAVMVGLVGAAALTSLALPLLVGLVVAGLGALLINRLAPPRKGP